MGSGIHVLYKGQLLQVSTQWKTVKLFCHASKLILQHSYPPETIFCEHLHIFNKQNYMYSVSPESISNRIFHVYSLCCSRNSYYFILTLTILK